MVAHTNFTCPQCFYCSENRYEPLFRNVRDYLGHVEGAWEFWRCSGCGSATLVPQPTISDLASYYPSVYSFTPELGQQSSLKSILAWAEYNLFFAPQYRAQVRKVCRVTDGDLGPRRPMLDIGCGRGLRLIAFQREGFNVHGMDFQLSAVKYVNEELKIPAVCTDIEGLLKNFEPESFDIVSAFWVLEHVPSPRVLLENCKVLLKPKGWLVCAVPLVDSMQAKILGSRWVNAREAPRHLSLPSQEGMRHLIREVGFDNCTLYPDSTIACSGMNGISLFPGAATSHFYSKGRVRSLIMRLMAATVSLITIPMCLVENYVLRRPASGIIFARKA